MEKKSYWKGLLVVVFISLMSCVVFFLVLSSMKTEPLFIRLVLKIGLGFCVTTTLVAVLGGPLLIWSMNSKSRNSGLDKKI
ncbi:MAG: hypothetical protein WC508_01790 [Patescibacteria group bacterium]